MKWYEKIYTDVWRSKLRSFARKKYSQFDDVDDIFEESLQTLYINLADYDEDSVSDALIITTFRNIMIDRQRRQHGYPRPEKWLREHGALGNLLFKLHCLKGLSRGEIMQQLPQQPEVAAAETPPPEVYQTMADALLVEMSARDACKGVRLGSVSMDAPIGSEQDAGTTLGEGFSNDTFSTPDQQSLEDEQQSLLRFLLALEGDEDASRWPAEPAPPISDQDRLILRMYYYSGLTEKAVAEAVGLSPPKLRRRRQAIVTALGEWLQGQGYEGE